MRLFVGNLPFEIEDEDLKQLFSGAGACLSATVVKDRATGRSRGFGFVEMTNDEEARRAIADLNGKAMGGRNLNVSEARERGAGGGPSGPRPAGRADAARRFGPDLPPGGRSFRKDGRSRRGLRGRKRSI